MACKASFADCCHIHRHYIVNGKDYRGELCGSYPNWFCHWWEGSIKCFDNHGNIFFWYDDGTIIYKEEFDRQADEEFFSPESFSEP